MAQRNLPTANPIPQVSNLRTVMGVRHPCGWHPVDAAQIAWQAIPSRSQPDMPQQLVCLHAAGSGSREFRPLASSLPGVQLVFMDWPSHGRSHNSIGTAFSPPLTLDRCVRQLHALVNHLGLARPFLLGSGFGAAVALRYAAENPSRIPALVLCQPSGLVPPILAKEPTTATNPAARLQQLRTAVLKPHMQAALTQSEESLHAAQPALRAALESLPCPVLFALSRENRTYPLRKSLNLLSPILEKAPHHRVTTFEGSFHPLWDEPQRFARILNAFVQANTPHTQHQHAWQLVAADFPTRTMNLWKCVRPNCQEEKALPEGQNPNEHPDHLAP